MQPPQRVLALAFIGGAMVLSLAHPAQSATLSYSTTSAGTTGSGAVNSPTVPGSDFYGNTFTSPTSVIAGSPSPGYGFYDDFIFSIGGAAANAITSTMNLASVLAITDLQVRLYSYDSNPLLPVLGSPIGGAVNAWSSEIDYSPGMTGFVSVLPTTILNPGTYVLEIRGNVLGSAGGSYAGTLNLSPVPLPAALPLMLAGFGLLSGVRIASGSAQSRRRTWPALDQRRLRSDRAEPAL